MSLTEWHGDRDELWEYIYELEALLTPFQKVFLYDKGVISIGKLSELLHIPYEEAYEKYFRGFRE